MRRRLLAAVAAIYLHLPELLLEVLVAAVQGALTAAVRGGRGTPAGTIRLHNTFEGSV